MGVYQSKIAQRNLAKGYNSEDLKTLTLGLCKETGEVARAVLNMSPDYIQKLGRRDSNLEEELHDCLANLMGLDLGI